MGGRGLLATLSLLLLTGTAPAADLARGAAPARFDRLPGLHPIAVRLRPACEEGDEPVVLRCLPRIVLPPEFARSALEQVALLDPVRKRPYRQVFSWGD